MKKYAIVITVVIFLIGSLISIRNIVLARSEMMGMPGMGPFYEETRTVEDLPVHPATGEICLIDHTELLSNSYEKLKDDPNNSQLEQKIIQLAKRLAKPQTPSPLTWQILIDKKILIDDMKMSEAIKILGNPTNYWHHEDTTSGHPRVKKELYHVMWYYNYEGLHMAPALEADANDNTNTLRNWQVTRH